ncbi:MAG: DUF177 domain-containing protein [Candidatus Omnitrophota bacterium]
MKINLNEIPKDGIVLKETKAAPDLDIERDDFEFYGPVTIISDINRDHDNVQILINIEGEIRFTCARCLSPLRQIIKREVKIFKTLKEERSVDLTQIAREEIILGYPLKLLCNDKCKGLCPICGINLNKSQCDCKPQEMSSGGINIDI